ncbi:bifunctional adenosylcobinamide kinase/adenosylcobinamide-phosphate guanylyltransferase [Evansella clarkii]|uniref:bifunctional adenosylcobinamide kinase/adenosylcobinamide-phosphate guanylyltransferase n=1 Tax=Evansella clarkii TaxID=79879 RepID=UPI000B44971A|nr:bifunctional adenosylcobinamide kinase/adenosylcobinamide-phosphate guanylyltransferase [Evansella clarkii]
MQLVTGGACSGKRKLVKHEYGRCSWITAYEGKEMKDWLHNWKEGTVLVLEGWEKWIACELEKNADDFAVRQLFTRLIKDICEEEKSRDSTAVIIMNEMGRGIVPVSPSERRLRDLAGWILQDTAEKAEKVTYVWSGLAKQIK